MPLRSKTDCGIQKKNIVSFRQIRDLQMLEKIRKV